MGIIRAMAVMQGPSGLAKDRYINTWHFNMAAGEITPDVATNIGTSLDIFYGAVDTYIRSEIERVDYRLYDLADEEPREPTLVPAVAQPSGTGSPFPFEVASCLSFYGERNLPRRRGRVYLGPLTTASSDSRPVTGEPRPSADFRTDVLAGAAAMQAAVQSAGGDGAGIWVVYSPRSVELGQQSNHPVTDAWMDDAFDTQRRRGDAPQERSTVSIL